MDNNNKKIKSKNTKVKRPLSNNIEQYISSHELTRQRFADQLNEYLQKQYPDFEIIYTANSIWTFTSRKTKNFIGSVPRDHRAVDAIASIIGKPLDELMRKYLSMEDFVNSMFETGKNNVNEDIAKVTETVDNVSPYFDIKAFCDLPDDVIVFAFNLLNEDVNEEDGQLLINLKVGIRADGRNGKVEIMYYYKDGYMTYSYNSPDYQTFLDICEYDNGEISMLHNIVEDDEYCALEEVGLFRDVYCFIASMVDLPDYEEYAYLSGYYNVKFVLNIDEDAITLLQMLKEINYLYREKQSNDERTITLLQMLKKVNYLYGLKQSNSVEALNKHLGDKTMRQLIELGLYYLVFKLCTKKIEYETFADYLKKIIEIIDIIDKETYEKDIKEIKNLLEE